MRLRTAIWTAVTLLALTTPSLADPMFSVTDLGTADPNSNYLDALTPTDQAAFLSGSFDVFAHPPQPGYFTDAHQGDIIRTDLNNGDFQTIVSGMVTSNNKGVDLGYGTECFPDSQMNQPMIVMFTPSPHSVIDPYK